jgi:hypothetical protein
MEYVLLLIATLFAFTQIALAHHKIRIAVLNKVFWYYYDQEVEAFDRWLAMKRKVQELSNQLAADRLNLTEQHQELDYLRGKTFKVINEIEH